MLYAEQLVLKYMYSHIGRAQVTSTDLAFYTDLVLKNALDKENGVNWKDDYEQVAENDVPRKANVIESHCMFKQKDEEDCTLKLKGRIVLHRNRDDENKDIRKDCAAADMVIVRMAL